MDTEQEIIRLSGLINDKRSMKETSVSVPLIEDEAVRDFFLGLGYILKDALDDDVDLKRTVIFW